MDSLDVIKVCLRRWYVFIPMVLIAAGAGVGLSRQLTPTYSAIGSYAFVYTHPEAVLPSQPDPRNQNPLIGNGNAALLGEAVQANLNSAAMQETLGGTNRGYAPDATANAGHYSVTFPPQSASYVVQTWADSSEAAAKVLQAVLKAAPQSAKDAQERAGAPELSRYTTFVTAPTQTTELPPQSPTKLLITVLAIGAVAGAALSLLIDRLLTNRPRRRPPTRHRRPGRAGKGAGLAEKPAGGVGDSAAAEPLSGPAPRRAASGSDLREDAGDPSEARRETVTS